MVVDVVVGFVLLVLSQDILTGHSGDDRQVSWRGLGQGGIALVQQELAVIDDPGSCSRTHTQFQFIYVYTRKCDSAQMSGLRPGVPDADPF